jgi:hypothetical protein
MHIPRASEEIIFEMVFLKVREVMGHVLLTCKERLLPDD